MSYEGYVQIVCENGHRYDVDAHHGGVTCHVCQAGPAASNAVDETNCYSEGIILPEDWDRFLLAPEVIETCNLGHPHVVKPAVYRIPTDEELAALQCYHRSGRWFRCATNEEIKV